MKRTIAATSTTGRKIHMGWDSGQLFCQLTPSGARVKDIITELGDGAEATIDALAAAKVAPSKLCGHCYSRYLRSRYAKHLQGQNTTPADPRITTNQWGRLGWSCDRSHAGMGWVNAGGGAEDEGAARASLAAHDAEYHEDAP
ncbi:hypothetical protein [Nocardiopsis synnemataformans]|uniref:hypothetical protein n=1 Tax=Nocardiopsis synnemataformans TaxID=61305 RepID=UPI003EB7D5BE